jgi:hypothetical protein
MNLTPLPIGPEQTLESPATTNAAFLAGIFGTLEGEDRPIVLGIPGAINAGTKWLAGTAWTPGVDTSDADLNWYFTLSTFSPADGTYRRKKVQFARAFGVMLDDVGTKAAPRERLDRCPPSYLIESSSGNFQAGYIFDVPCADVAQVEALQASLVKTGLCDSGATGPSARLGRMPVGINGKYSPAQRCRLVEWHPERRYSPEQIAELLELEPMAPTGARSKAPVSRKKTACPVQCDVYQPRASENAVLVALRQRGLYKAPLGSGKHDITCPWVNEHTDAIDNGAAYFEPAPLYPLGGFKCQHAHGATKHVGALLEFVEVSSIQAKNKASIVVEAGELDAIVDAAERELANGGRHYQRGGLIVTVATDPGTSETRIKPVTPNGLTRALAANAIWQKFDARKDDYVVTDPPTRHVSVLFDSDAYAHLPVLRGIARQPYLRPDGSLMTTAGYDAATRMYGVFNELGYRVPASPSKADAKRALQELLPLLDEFSFAAPHDRSAALSMLLTAAIRPSLSAAPMGHIRAPQIASGKSYLSALFAAFAGPAKPSAYAFPPSEEECAKLLLSALMESPPVVVFDNLTSDLIAHKSLCSALTEEYITGRVLGVSKTATVPTNTLFLSSGNNVDAVNDMTRRVLTINLDPACETPATRTFKGDPLARVRAHRERFVTLVLIIVRAYIVAGSPDQGLRPLNSYGEWSRLARSPLVWLGQPDPATAVFSRMAVDPDREALGRMLTSWRAVFGSSPTPVRDVLASQHNFGAAARAEELIEVAREVAELRGEINANRLGNWIARHEGRIVDGVRFVRDTNCGGSARWCVRDVVATGAASRTNQ